MLQWLAGEPSVRIIEINQVWNTVLKVIEDARDELVLVSPYNEYSVPLTEALAKAAKTGVPIVAVCREEQKGKEDTHFKWLSRIGADVHLVSRLHAKIYYNESTAVVTSMNLLKSSATDSKEIGFVINDSSMRDQIREYVEKNLIAHSKQLSPAREVAKPKTPAVRLPKAEPKQASTRGWCIRCREEIPYNPDAPLCRKCFRSWKRDEDRDYPENYCHRRGEEWKTSFAKPLCLPCYRAVARVGGRTN